VGFFARARTTNEQAASLARIEAGGIPVGAEARLQALSSTGGLFTSGLSVNEFALLAQLGQQPVAQVMGASVIRAGWQYLPALPPGLPPTAVVPTAYGRSIPAGGILQNRYGEASPSQVRSYQWHANLVCELDVLTDAWNMARRRALDRLAEEARQAGADAVVGVHLHRGDHDLGKGTIEYVVTGTAIRHPGSVERPEPVLTDVSVQEYWRLCSAGHEPVGLTATTAVVFASPSRSTRLRRLRTKPQNQELTELSGGFHTARDTVRRRLLGQASAARAAGVVGVKFTHSVRRDRFALASSLTSVADRGWHRGSLGLPYYVSGHADTERSGWVITMHAAGTALRRRRAAANVPVKTQMEMRGR
jgi:uncharacterized protein YbjQ (UPF0145 family)